MREKAAEGRGLYCPEFEHDACGIGAVVDIQGRASHETVDDALKIVEKLEHRAGKDAEGKTGDGVGILTQIPHAFFARAAAEASIALPGRRDYGVGMFFLPRDGLKRRQAQRQFELVTEKEGMAFLGWREVPVHPEILGQRARDKMPSIFQAFVARPEETAPGLDFDRKLYVARRVFEHLSGDTYVVSLSSRTVVYKGMFLVHQLRAFYPDLQSINYTSALAIVHSRFSTNTNPSWERAHPNRLIAHNGEINTIRGNMDRMLAREETMFSPLLATDRDKVLPVVNASGSDSAMLDNTLEFLMMAGMDLPLAVMACIPEPWRNAPSPAPAGTYTTTTPPSWSPGMARRPSCSPTGTWWERCWTATACALPGTTSPTTAGSFSPPRWGCWTSHRGISWKSPGCGRARCCWRT